LLKRMVLQQSVSNDVVHPLGPVLRRLDHETIFFEMVPLM